MFSRLGFTGIAVTVLVAALAAQRGGGGGGTGGGGGGGTRLDEFAGKLKLNPKTQTPALQGIFSDGAKDAAPVATEMLRLRQVILNLELNGKTADVPAALASYTAEAAKMAGIETAVFQKVFATLQPGQQSRTPDAFAFMAGFFQSAAVRAGGRGGRAGGGGGGGR